MFYYLAFVVFLLSVSLCFGIDFNSGLMQLFTATTETTTTAMQVKEKKHKYETESDRLKHLGFDKAIHQTKLGL